MAVGNIKIRYLIIVGVTYSGVYLLFRYGVWLLAPFVAAYVLAWFMKPVKYFLVRYLRLNNGLAATVTIVLAGTVFACLLCVAGGSLANGIGRYVSRFVTEGKDVEDSIRDACSSVEYGMGIERGMLYSKIGKCVRNVDMANVFNSFLGKSTSKLVSVMEIVVSGFVMIVAVFYLLKDEDDLKKIETDLVLGQEIRRVKIKVYQTGIAYLKTQLILMSITVIICYIGFWIAGVSCPFIFAFVAGFLDALPMIGIGIVLLPVVVIYLIKSRYISAVIIFIVFLLCYFSREFFEPKIMGKNAGMSPIMTMVTMYAGYKLFGIVGVVTGPFAYIIANEIVEILMECIGDDINDKKD